MIRFEELAQESLFTIGQLYLAQKAYSDAIGTWNKYVAQYPTGPHWSDAQRLIKDAEYQIGADAVEDKKYDAARQAWTVFLQKYPLDGRAPAILFQFGQLLHVEKKWQEQFTIIDPAQLPESPESPNASLFLLAGTVIGLGAGLLGAFLLEVLDPSVKSLRQLESLLAYPVLLTLPQVKLPRGESTRERPPPAPDSKRRSTENKLSAAS